MIRPNLSPPPLTAGTVTTPWILGFTTWLGYSDTWISYLAALLGSCAGLVLATGRKGWEDAALGYSDSVGLLDSDTRAWLPGSEQTIWSLWNEFTKTPKWLIGWGGGRTSGERPSGPHFTLFLNNTVLLGLGGPGSQMHHRNTLVNLILYEIGPGRLPTGRMSLIEARQKKETHAFTKKYTEESWSNGCWSRNCLPKMKTMARFVFC